MSPSHPPPPPPLFSLGPQTADPNAGMPLHCNIFLAPQSRVVRLEGIEVLMQLLPKRRASSAEAYGLALKDLPICCRHAPAAALPLIINPVASD